MQAARTNSFSAAASTTCACPGAFLFPVHSLPVCFACPGGLYDAGCWLGGMCQHVPADAASYAPAPRRCSLQALINTCGSADALAGQFWLAGSGLQAMWAWQHQRQRWMASWAGAPPDCLLFACQNLKPERPTAFSSEACWSGLLAVTSQSHALKRNTSDPPTADETGVRAVALFDNEEVGSDSAQVGVVLRLGLFGVEPSDSDGSIRCCAAKFAVQSLQCKVCSEICSAKFAVQSLQCCCRCCCRRRNRCRHCCQCDAAAAAVA